MQTLVSEYSLFNPGGNPVVCISTYFYPASTENILNYILAQNGEGMGAERKLWLQTKPVGRLGNYLTLIFVQR